MLAPPPEFNDGVDAMEGARWSSVASQSSVPILRLLLRRDIFVQWLVIVKALQQWKTSLLTIPRLENLRGPSRIFRRSTLESITQKVSPLADTNGKLLESSMNCRLVL